MSRCPLQPDISVAPHTDSHAAINWLVVATAIYACVAGLLLLRLAVGLCLTWRLARAATPIREPWTADWRVRISDAVGGPVTFGSTILLPPHYVDWDLQKRRAVLAHEGAHVVNRDFYVLLLASLNRAVFWFSPVRVVAAHPAGRTGRNHQRRQRARSARGQAVLRGDSARSRAAGAAGAGRARNGQGVHGARARRADSRGNRGTLRSPAGASGSGRPQPFCRLSSVSAGSIAYTTAPPPAIDSTADAATATRKPRAGCVLFIGPDLDLCHLPGRQRALRATQRAAKVRLAAAGDGTYSYPAADGQISWAVSDEQPPSELVLNQNGRELRAARIAELSWQGVESDDASAARRLCRLRMRWRRPACSSVTRDGDRLYVRETGRPQIRGHGPWRRCVCRHRGDLVIFLRDGQAKVTQVLLQEPLSGARLAPRISAARAKMIEEEFARRIAEVPDRFREQAPLPGSKEAILRGIDDLQRGTPNYERMSTSLAAKVRRQASELRPCSRHSARWSRSSSAASAPAVTTSTA